MKKTILLLILGIFVLLQMANPGQEKPLDVPYVPTPPEVVEKMLRLAEVNQADLLFDLGCGDGRIVITAALRYGTKGMGVDIDPQRVQESRDNAAANKVEHLASFREQDIFKTDFSDATVVSMYLLTKINLRLRPSLLTELRPGTRVVSHSFSMHEWQPDKTERVLVDKIFHPIYLWIIPSNMTGSWNIIEPHRSAGNRARLKIEQLFQVVTGLYASGTESIPLREVYLSGNKIQFSLESKTDQKLTVKKYHGQIQGNSIKGTITYKQGNQTKTLNWLAERNPATIRPLDQGLNKTYFEITP